nr:hypothetical protein [Burkholderia contaminans]
MAERHRLPETRFHAGGEHRELLLVGLRVECHAQRGVRPFAERAFSRLQVTRELLLHARVTHGGQRIAQRKHALGCRDCLDRMAERDRERLRRRGFGGGRRDAHAGQQRPDQRGEPRCVAIGRDACRARDDLRVVGRERAIGLIGDFTRVNRGDVPRGFGQRVAREVDVSGLLRERGGRIVGIEPQPLRREITVVRRGQREQRPRPEFGQHVELAHAKRGIGIQLRIRIAQGRDVMPAGERLERIFPVHGEALQAVVLRFVEDAREFGLQRGRGQRVETRQFL